MQSLHLVLVLLGFNAAFAAFLRSGTATSPEAAKTVANYLTAASVKEEPAEKKATDAAAEDATAEETAEGKADSNEDTAEKEDGKEEEEAAKEGGGGEEEESVSPE